MIARNLSTKTTITLLKVGIPLHNSTIKPSIELRRNKRIEIAREAG